MSSQSIRTQIKQASVAAIAAMAVSSPAMADSGAITLSSVNPANIEVVGDGNTYTAPAIALVSLASNAHITLDAGVSGKIKNWKAWLKFKAPGSFWVQFGDDGYSKSYSAGSRPKTVNTNISLKVPYGSLAPYVTAQCNNLANSLRGQGLSNDQIFAQDRTIVVEASGALSWEMSGVAGNGLPQEVQTYKTFNIVCKNAAPSRVPPPVSNDPTRNIPDVDQASLSIFEVSTLNGACNLTLSGVIVTKAANKLVKFRYKDNQGNQSDIKTVNTDHTKTVNFAHKYALAGTGNKQGKIRIAIVNDNFSSSWTDYNVNCNPNAPGGLVDNSGVQTSDLTKGAATGVAPTTSGAGTQSSSALPGKRVGSGVPRPGGFKADLGQADLMATPLGMSLAGGPRSWGSSVVISNTSHATVKGVGPAGNLCRFWPAAFRPFNKGTVKSGAFAATIYRNNHPIHTANFNLDAKSGLPANSGWYKFNLDLPQGTSTVKLVLDSNSTVAESDENNNVYLLTVTVNFPCTNLGKAIAPKTTMPGTRSPGSRGKSIIMPRAVPQKNRR